VCCGLQTDIEAAQPTVCTQSDRTGTSRAALGVRARVDDGTQLVRKAVCELDEAVRGAKAVGRHWLVGVRENLMARGGCVVNAWTHNEGSNTHLAGLDAHGADDVVRVADAAERGHVARVLASQRERGRDVCATHR
jgi:hypothetical protein